MSLIKICGLSRKEDIEYANACLPDFVGFVFAESRRQVTAGQAAALRERLDSRVKPVGVFVNAAAKDIQALAESGVIGMAQLHGDEDAEYITRLKDGLPIPVIKAVRLGGAAGSARPGGIGMAAGPEGAEDDVRKWDAVGIVPYGEVFADADYFLFDAFSAGGRGGSGLSFDWSLVPACDKPYFLAGGLNEDNLAEAIGLLHPYAVDLSSGAETDGLKDFAKMARLVEITRGC